MLPLPHNLEKKSSSGLVAEDSEINSTVLSNAFYNSCLLTGNSTSQRDDKNNQNERFYYIQPQTLVVKENLTEKTLSENLLAKENYLIYRGDQLVAASLDSLIKHLVPHSDYYPSTDFVFGFLLCARLFIKPHKLLQRVSALWDKQQELVPNISDAVDSSKSTNNLKFESCASAVELDAKVLEEKRATLSIKISAHHCIRLLSQWMEFVPYDFRDERLMQQVRILARKCVYVDTTLGKEVSRILQQLVQKLSTLEKHEHFLNKYTHMTNSNPSANAGFNDYKLQSNQDLCTDEGLKVLYETLVERTHNEVSPAAEESSQSNQRVQHRTSDSSTNSGNSTSNHFSNHLSNSSTANTSELKGLIFLCPNAEQLAHQLTAIELEYLSHIGLEEFVQDFVQEYKKSSPINSSDKKKAKSAAIDVLDESETDSDMKKTRNLEAYIDWFNRLSYLTASEIVKYLKKKQRVRMIEYWIEAAHECFNIGNFNSSMAIIAGLNLSAISRLKKTWMKVQSDKFAILEHQMDPTSNFQSYRATLKAAKWRSEGATNLQERVIIPFFSLFVKDLYFLNEGCSNMLPGSLINFEKCSQLTKQIMEFHEWQKVECPFSSQAHVKHYLLISCVLNDNTLSIASYDCEPPENTQEKGRYKTLKLEIRQ